MSCDRDSCRDTRACSWMQLGVLFGLAVGGCISGIVTYNSVGDSDATKRRLDHIYEEKLDEIDAHYRDVCLQLQELKAIRLAGEVPVERVTPASPQSPAANCNKIVKTCFKVHDGKALLRYLVSRDMYYLVVDEDMYRNCSIDDSVAGDWQPVTARQDLTERFQRELKEREEALAAAK